MRRSCAAIQRQLILIEDASDIFRPEHRTVRGEQAFLPFFIVEGLTATTIFSGITGNICLRHVLAAADGGINNSGNTCTGADAVNLVVPHKLELVNFSD